MIFNIKTRSKNKSLLKLEEKVRKRINFGSNKIAVICNGENEYDYYCNKCIFTEKIGRIYIDRSKKITDRNGKKYFAEYIPIHNEIQLLGREFNSYILLKDVYKENLL